MENMPSRSAASDGNTFDPWVTFWFFVSTCYLQWRHDGWRGPTTAGLSTCLLHYEYVLDSTLQHGGNSDRSGFQIDVLAVGLCIGMCVDI